MRTISATEDKEPRKRKSITLDAEGIRAILSNPRILVESFADLAGDPYQQGLRRERLDRMMREKNVDPGLTELMIVDTVEFARENRITHISLNFAAFRSLFERADKISAGPVVRTTRNIIRFFSNWFQVESLYRFNAKFQPQWRTRYVLYPKSKDLVGVAWAALRAERFISGFGRRGH